MSVYGLPLNAEPWTVPNLGIGRRGGKVFPTMAKSRALTAYQEAVKEQMGERYPDAPVADGPLSLSFVIWRNLDVYQGAKRKVHRNPVDATNIQKALEDALQGVLYVNDSQVKFVSTEVVEQGPDVEPYIVISLMPYDRVLDPNALRELAEQAAVKPNLPEQRDRSTFDVEGTF